MILLDISLSNSESWLFAILCDITWLFLCGIGWLYYYSEKDEFSSTFKNLAWITPIGFLLLPLIVMLGGTMLLLWLLFAKLPDLCDKWFGGEKPYKELKKEAKENLKKDDDWKDILHEMKLRKKIEPIKPKEGENIEYFDQAFGENT